MTAWPDPADLAGFSEGALDNAQRFLGAHFTETETCRFAVWAPNARAVAVAGDFNDWSGTAHPMEFHSGPGIWTAEVSGVQQGDKYKYVVTRPDGQQRFKADPFAVYAEVRPGTPPGRGTFRVTRGRTGRGCAGAARKTRFPRPWPSMRSTQGRSSAGRTAGF